MTPFTFEMLSLTKKELVFDNTTSVTVNTSAGVISIYAKHMPLITNVVPGEITLKENNTVHKYEHDGGIIVMDKNVCTFFKTQKTQEIIPLSENKLSEEDITKHMVGEFIRNLSNKEGIRSS